MPVHTSGYKRLRSEFTFSFISSAWDDTVTWWFGCAEWLYHESHIPLPDDWEFQDSPAHNGQRFADLAEGYPEQLIKELWDDGVITDRDILRFGQTLFRYANLLRMNEQDY